MLPVKAVVAGSVCVHGWCWVEWLAPSSGPRIMSRNWSRNWWRNIWKAIDPQQCCFWCQCLQPSQIFSFILSEINFSPKKVELKLPIQSVWLIYYGYCPHIGVARSGPTQSVTWGGGRNLQSEVPEATGNPQRENVADFYNKVTAEWLSSSFIQYFPTVISMICKWGELLTLNWKIAFVRCPQSRKWRSHLGRQKNENSQKQNTQPAHFSIFPKRLRAQPQVNRRAQHSTAESFSQPASKTNRPSVRESDKNKKFVPPIKWHGDSRQTAKCPSSPRTAWRLQKDTEESRRKFFWERERKKS